MTDETQHEFTPKGDLKRTTIKQVCQWIKQSLSKVREYIVKSIKKCGIINVHDGSEIWQMIYEEENNDDEQEQELDTSDDDF